MKLNTLVLLFCLCSCSLLAQNNYTIKGSINDTASINKLVNTSVIVLNAKDSTLVQFTRATNDGTFAINNLHKGKFILLVTYPNYADYVEHFQLDSVKTSYDFGKINITLKSALLKEILIKGKIDAIKIKGDTTEFDARAYVIQPNSKVEDLLKQLPGIQVDKDGKITAQGETVNKVLVDGEEFFGDDPTLVTKNIRGDMVDKVQLYDKKSDQATFTGIDDGIKTKTINIKLKEDKKNGYFGKVDGELGTDGYYQGQVLFNKFKAKEKISAYTTLSNTGKIGLGWQDNQKYGNSNNVEFVDGGIMINGSGGDDLEPFDGRYNGQGIPTASTGGVHYDSKFNKDKELLNTNYKIGALTIDGDRNTQAQKNYSGAILNSNDDQNSHNYIFRQKLDAMLQIQLDSSSNLKVSVDGTAKNSNTRTRQAGQTSNGVNALINTNARTINNNGDATIFNMSAFYTKKFKKLGRTFSLNLSESANQNNDKGYLKSEIDYYNAHPAPDSTSKIDQYKTNNTVSNVLSANFTYTEPLSKKLSLVFNYGLGLNNSSADRRSYNPSAPGQYDVFVDSLSNNFKLDQLSNQAGAIFNYKNAKTIVNFGTKVSDVSYKQVDLLTSSTNNILKRNFVNWSPQASYQYKFSQQQSLNFSYNGSTTQPSINQIQPLKVNLDPLNITLGNPDLTPSFTNRFSGYYSSYKVLSDQSFYANGSYSFTMNPIVSNVNTDYATGKSTYQSSNLTNESTSRFNIYGRFSRKIPKIEMNAGLGVSANGSTSYNLSNNALNKTTSNTYSATLNLSKYKEKKYDFYLSGSPNYTIGGSSLQPDRNNNGSGFNAEGYIGIYLPGNIQITNDNSYQYTAPTQSFPQDFHKFIMNASIIKKFLKDQNLQVSITGNDLLNQNTGFSRNATERAITQTSYTTIKRYFMLSVVWDFNHMGGGAPAPKK